MGDTYSLLNIEFYRLKDMSLSNKSMSERLMSLGIMEGLIISGEVNMYSPLVKIVHELL